MRIAIIGAGFTGLAASYQLVKFGHAVTVFEKDSFPGGLALGFYEKGWEWSAEKHYHHWFTNDTCVLDLAKEISHAVIVKRPKTSIYLDNHIYQFDSPLHVLTFQKLSPTSRLRMAATLGALRYNPFWKNLEHIKATDFLLHYMGQEAYEKIWEPQLINKFSSYAKTVSLAWFWARIKKRTSHLAYPVGGFLSFAESLVGKIKSYGGNVFFDTEVTNIESNEKISLKFSQQKKNHNAQLKNQFDKVIVTLPSFFFLKIAQQLPEKYKQQLSQLQGLGAVNLILRLKNQFLLDGTYWLSVCDKKSPVMAIVEHTNFMDKKYYNNEHIVYLGNYLPPDHNYFKMQPKELLKIFDPFLRKINETYQSSLIDCHLFTVPFAQPIIPLDYSKIIPPFETPLPNVYLANIQQVYPWDRGTNYAVELGQKVAKMINYEKL